MAIDPRMLEEALRMNDGQAPREQTGGVMEMLTPKFNEVQFAGAGELPPLNLNLDNIDFDPQKFLEDSTNMPFDLKSGIENEIESILTNADAGDEEDGIRAISALGLDTNPNISPDEKAQGYKEISDLIQEGGISAVEEFVRSIYAPDGNDEAIPEWALPASVFGTFLMNEPGDWKQAVLQARGKTAVTMLNKGVTDKATKDKLDLDIRKKALDLYTASKAGNKPTATSLVGLVGKVTPASLAKYETSGKLSDLVLITDTKNVGDLLSDFTASSVAKFQKSNDYNDLVRVPGKGDKGTTDLEFLKEFTPASVQEYLTGGKTDTSVLVRKPSSTAKSTESLFDLLETYTAESIDAYKISNNFSDLELKDASSWSPTIGSTTDAKQENDLKTMETVAFRNNLNTAPLEVKLQRLRDYSFLHAQTTKKVNEKSQAGDILKQRLPMAAFSVKAYAEELGLDVTQPEVARILNVAQLKLPYASEEDIGRFGALNSLQKKVQMMGQILEATPGDLTGVKGYLFDTDAARIASDLIPGFEIPIGATISQVFGSVAEVNLIKDILNESRFSDKDREMVQQFINGRNFKTREEAKLRHTEVMKIVSRGIEGMEFTLENYQLPPGMSPSDNDPEAVDARLRDRKTRLLETLNSDG